MTVLLAWGPVVLHMALIFAASSTSDPDPLPGGLSDKVLHLGVYALLGALVARALAGGRLGMLTWRHCALAVLLAALYGVSDEWHQSFVPGRTPDAMDVLADVVGATVGAVGLLLVARIVGRRARIAD